MPNHEIHENLSHLKISEIDEVILLYEGGVKVVEIAETYHINLQFGSLAPLLPAKILNIKCPHCNIPMNQKRSRSVAPPIYCPECGHIEGVCNCKNCTKERYEARNAVRNMVLGSQSVKHIESISITHWVYLTAFMAGGHIGGGITKPLEQFNIAPTGLNPLFSNHVIIEELYMHGIISVSDKSSIYAFPELKEGEKPSFYVDKVYFKINASLTTHSNNPEEVLELWRRVAASEVLEYIEFQIRRVNQTFSYSYSVEKDVFRLLDEFSTAQIFSMVWSSTNYSTRCFSERRLKRKDFTTHLMKACKRYADRAISEGWEVKSFNRCKQLPQSEIGKIFYNKVLGIGAKGFNLTPSSFNA